MRLAIEPGAWTTRAVAALESGRIVPISDSSSPSVDGFASLVVESGSSAAVGHMARSLSVQDARASQCAPFDRSARVPEQGTALDGGAGLSREVAAALFLRRVAQEAESAAGTSVDTVLFAVPSVQIGEASPALFRAAGLAGLQVLDIVEAEIAALLAAAARNRRIRGRVLHLDFGHSATRVSLLRCDPDEIEILAAREDTARTGETFLAALHASLIDSLALHLSPLHLKTAVRASQATEVLDEIWTGLRGTQAAAISVPMDVAGQPFLFSANRAELEHLFEANLAAAIELSAICLRVTRTGPEGVDAAVVTGLPFSAALVQERLGALMPRIADPRRWVIDPGLAVEGTAQHGARVGAGLSAIPIPPELRGAARSAVYLVLREAGTGANRFEKIFEVEQVLPASARKMVYLAGRGSERVLVAIAIDVVGGESPRIVDGVELRVPAEARELGALEIEVVYETNAELVIRGLAGGPDGPRTIQLPTPTVGRDRAAFRRLSWIRQVGFLGSGA